MIKFELTEKDLAIVIAAMIVAVKFMPDSRTDVERVLDIMVEQIDEAS